ncbi:hypothetical protein LFL97_32830 [Burkholderia sp. JSH-S8]|nr:hypothetical protein LFL97_32830 [Burkholderia sp. JSH-S8]
MGPRIDLAVEHAICDKQIAVLPSLIGISIGDCSIDGSTEICGRGPDLTATEAGRIEEQRSDERYHDCNHSANVITAIPHASLELIERGCNVAELWVSASMMCGITRERRARHRRTKRTAPPRQAVQIGGPHAPPCTSTACRDSIHCSTSR